MICSAISQEVPISTPPQDKYLIRPGVDLLGPDRWSDVFGRPGPLTVEVGFGKDEFLLDLAETNPDGLFLGIEFSRPRTRSYLNKIRFRGLTNVRVLLEHAANAVGLCLGDGSVGELFVLFPDPWPKKKHARNRLISPWFVREADRVMIPGGRATMATDDVPYRDQILEVVEGHGSFRNLRGPGEYGPRPEGFDQTIFERRWVEQGRGIYYMQFVKEGA